MASIPIYNGQAQALQNSVNGVAAATLGSLVFPADLGQNNNFNYWMSFSFYQYNPSVAFQANLSALLTQVGTIRLPLPNQMIDQQDINYDVESLGLGVAEGMKAGNALLGGVGATVGAIAGAVTSSALSPSGTAISQILQPSGAALNPFMTVMFKSPAYKTHQFAWLLAPTLMSESATLSTIGNTFRMNQLPGVVGQTFGALLSYPNLVIISVSNVSGSFTYVFKPAVIQSSSLNFAPAGQPSFFGSTQAPSQVELRLSILETEFWTQQDYGMANLLSLGSAASSLLNYIGTGSTTTQTQTVAPATNGLGAGPV